MTALERAARALKDADHAEYAGAWVTDDGRPPLSFYEHQARAVLMAVRHEGEQPHHTDERRFNRRLDAILNEPTTPTKGPDPEG